MTMDVSSAEKGEGVELHDVSAPPETQVPLMSREDIENEHQRLKKEHGQIMKEFKGINKDLKELNRRQKAQKYGSDVYFAANPVASIAMIVIGSLYLEDCKVQPYIPICLVVWGSVGILRKVIFLSGKCVCKDSKICQKANSWICGFISTFMLFCFIMCCVWIYGVQEVEFEDTLADTYCHKTLYYFAFWLMNIIFFLLGFVIILSLCQCCCQGFSWVKNFFSKNAKVKNNPSSKC